MDPNSTTPGHIIIKMLKVKDNERILKAAREKGESYLQRSFHKTISLQFLKRNFAGKKGMARNIQSHENLDYSIQQSYQLELKDR